MVQPNILKIGKNVKLITENIGYLLDEQHQQAVEEEINRQVMLLYQLGYDHYAFAKRIDKRHWRQKISRFYYGVYNVRRSLTLKERGDYFTDSSDHQKHDRIPDDFPQNEFYISKFKELRDDRNRADYNHNATEKDLTLTVDEVEELSNKFIKEIARYLRARGVQL